ncbi:heme-binding domain-containing protein [Planobacterium sp. GCR5]|uniref:Heme-binding domain-containing protein n=2 Tax=Planobacterium oryzisoli TaxID=2771435 RepID=A0A931EA69_9FLAO|nr:heme-binding domain-containing protein [Planobacterium oryzisoli]
MKTWIKVLGYVAAGVLLIQLIPVDQSNPPVDKTVNFMDLQKTPASVRQIIEKSCYDCHSFETKYPPVAKIAPISWSIAHNVQKARENLNFSTWGLYNSDQKKDILKRAAEMVEEKKMPVPGYIAQHPEARLNMEQRKALSSFFKEMLEEHQY